LVAVVALDAEALAPVLASATQASLALAAARVVLEVVQVAVSQEYSPWPTQIRDYVQRQLLWF